MAPLVDLIVPAELGAGDVFADRLARHPDRDVVLLEPGTRLGEAALERLAACVRDGASIATASVLSNAGALAYRAAAAAREIETLVARENAGIAIEIPSALPPCVFIARRALAQIALAEGSPAAVAAFCQAASEAGFRHVLCGDVYVETDAALPSQLPASAAWTDFAKRAPTTPLRRRADLARLRASPRPRLLFVTHDWGGGVELHVNDLARLLADDCEVLALRPSRSGTVSLRWLREGESLEAWFDGVTEWSACQDLLLAIGIARVHFHHVHGLPHQVLELPRALGVPHDVTLHDSFAICPQYHLADEAGGYCGEPDKTGCNACIAKRPAQWGLDIDAWRQAFHRLLRDAERVIAPSADIGARIQRYFPDVTPQVWPHPEMRSETPALHKVVVLGGLSAIKGMDLFEDCVRDAQARALPLHFTVLGHISRPLALDAEAPVAVLGSYGEARLGTLLALERPDAFLFLSRVPETYSYTLSVAMQSGKPIVATQIGAFAERLRGYPAASLVDPGASPRTVNDALLRALRSPAASRPVWPLAISAD